MTIKVNIIQAINSMLCISLGFIEDKRITSFHINFCDVTMFTE